MSNPFDQNVVNNNPHYPNSLFDQFDKFEQYNKPVTDPFVNVSEITAPRDTNTVVEKKNTRLNPPPVGTPSEKAILNARIAKKGSHECNTTQPLDFGIGSIVNVMYTDDKKNNSYKTGTVSAVVDDHYTVTFDKGDSEQVFKSQLCKPTDVVISLFSNKMKEAEAKAKAKAKAEANADADSIEPITQKLNNYKTLTESVNDNKEIVNINIVKEVLDPTNKIGNDAFLKIKITHSSDNVDTSDYDIFNKQYNLKANLDKMFSDHDFDEAFNTDFTKGKDNRKTIPTVDDAITNLKNMLINLTTDSSEYKAIYTFILWLNDYSKETIPNRLPSDWICIDYTYNKTTYMAYTYYKILSTPVNSAIQLPDVFHSISRENTPDKFKLVVVNINDPRSAKEFFILQKLKNLIEILKTNLNNNNKLQVPTTQYILMQQRELTKIHNNIANNKKEYTPEQIEKLYINLKKAFHDNNLVNHKYNKIWYEIGNGFFHVNSTYLMNYKRGHPFKEHELTAKLFENTATSMRKRTLKQFKNMFGKYTKKNNVEDKVISDWNNPMHGTTGGRKTNKNKKPYKRNRKTNKK
jgi:hypothetical protein